ncbi:MAG: glycosyltransferase family 4 protein [Verrucomicrobia bacterium]|nr:glycosyltransferase family 4 protein [Verrucomicrobiota bacterium]
MRFLMLNWRDPRNPLAGGAERVTLGYLSGLVRRGHEVFWYTHQFEGGPEEDSIEGVKIIRCGGVWSSRCLAQRWHRRQKPFDLVIDQHHGIPWFAPWWCRAPCIAYIHEVLGPIWDAFYLWPWNVIGRWQERWTHWLYRRVPFWTASKSTLDSLRRHGVQSITIIPYGVHTVAIPDLEAKPLAPPVRLIAVSRLAPNKRVDQAIRTTRILLDHKLDVRLKIVGTGIVEANLRQLASELNLDRSVTFTGPLAEGEKDRLLQESHFLLHTSQREGWGLNVIEANAMGTPAVVYPVKGLVESTLHDETGLVAESETPEALAAAIVKAVQAPERYQFYRLRAWQRAKTFHWDTVLPKACDWLEAQARPGSGSGAQP